MQSLIFSENTSTIKLTVEQAKNLGIDILQDEIRGNLKTFGVWQIPISFNALCVSRKYGKKENSYHDQCLQVIVYGNRTMTNVKQGGYELNGYVSIKGKKYSCFTSCQTFEVEGKLIEVSVIHARVR